MRGRETKKELETDRNPVVMRIAEQEVLCFNQGPLGLGRGREFTASH